MNIMNINSRDSLDSTGPLSLRDLALQIHPRLDSAGHSSVSGSHSVGNIKW